MTFLLDEALKSNRVVLSVMGPHAGEDENAIFSRKMVDIAKCGRTLWLCCSPGARPDRTQPFAPEFVIFLDPVAKNGARPTNAVDRATELSVNRKDWFLLPGIGPVTGRLNNAYAFNLSEIELDRGPLDLWSYTTPGNEAVVFRLGASTLLAKRGDAKLDPLRAKTRFRTVRAVARLKVPLAVWVR